jgi:hypothetical protein
MIQRWRLVLRLSVVGSLCASPAFAASAAEKVAMFQVRLTTEPQVLAGCQRTGRVSDSSIEDLRKKIVRSGGNAGLLTFDSDDLERVYADVHRCEAVPK